MIKPPDGISSSRLFRMQLGVPRPLLAIEYRIPGIEHIDLFVRGLRSIEEAEAFDSAAITDVEDAKVSAGTSTLIAKSLCNEHGGLLFHDNNGPMSLLEDEFIDLLRAVSGCLDVISPTYLRSDIEKWGARLLEGASVVSNIRESIKMSYCVDHSDKYMVLRPDRYFGIDPIDLTDGQMMAFYAGLGAIKRLKGSNE